MIPDRAGTSKEICDSKRVRSFFLGELGGSAVSRMGRFLCSGVLLEQLEQFSLNSRTPRTRSSVGCSGCAFFPAWIPSFEFPARSFSRLLSGKPGAVQSVGQRVS